MSTQICNPCADSQVCIDGLDKYSLQDDTYYFVINCPPNVYCGGNSTIYLVCCDGTTMQQTIPQGSTVARRNALIADLVSRCARMTSFCDGGGGGGRPPGTNDPNDGTDPNNPVPYYGNYPKSWTVSCPDGNPYTFTVPAGIFIARTQTEADAAAQLWAKQMAVANKICLSAPLRLCCNGVAYSSTVVASGGIGVLDGSGGFGPSVFTWNIIGTLPIGLTAVPYGHNALRISGIPTTNGNYSFTIRAVDTHGAYMDKPTSIRIWGITDTSLPDATEGDPYSHQLTTTSGTAPYTYTLVTGGFPLGISMSSTGLIDGLAGEVGVFSPTIRVRDANGATCTKEFTLTSVVGCEYQNCSNGPFVNIGEPEPGYSQFAFAEPICYFCAMTTDNATWTTLRFHKYDPATDTFSLKATLAVTDASVFSNLVYDEAYGVFVTAALQTVVTFDPLTDAVATFTDLTAPAVGFVNPIKYIPEKLKVYGMFGRNGSGEYSLAHINFNTSKIIVDGYWATSGPTQTHPADLAYCPLYDTLYGANSGGLGGGLCKWDFASTTAFYFPPPLAMATATVAWNPDSNFLCCMAGVGYYEWDVSTDTVALTNSHPTIGLNGNAVYVQSLGKIVGQGWDDANPSTTFALTEINVSTLARNVVVTADDTTNYRGVVQFYDNSVMLYGDVDADYFSVVKRMCLT